MAKAVATAADLLVKALASASEADGEVKLTGTGGLFPKPEGVQDQALRLCLDGATPYLEVVRSVTAKRKGTETVTKYVRLTPAGFGRLVEATSQADIADVVLRYSSRLADSDREALYSALESRTSGPAAEQYSAAITALDTDAERRAAERDATAKRLQMERYRQTVALKKQAADRLEDALTFCRKEVAGFEALLAELAAGPEKESPRLPEKKSPPQHAPEPETPEDAGYRRQVVRRLVSSWFQQLEQHRTEGARAMETALGGMTGVRRVGTTGESVPFDGAAHECKRAVSDGESVRLVRPGWVLIEDDGPYTLLKALVE